MATDTRNPAGLIPFPTWLAVVTWIEADREIFYHAPMDRQPIRVKAVRGRGSYRYKVKITPPTASLRPSHPDRADPFWADAGHLNRFMRISDDRHREQPATEQIEQPAYSAVEIRTRARRLYGEQDPNPAPALTMREFTPQDHRIAQEAARRLGYKQYAYTSTSALWGYFCLAENPEHATGPHQQRILIATKELGIVAVQDLEDLKMYDLWQQSVKPARGTE